MSGCPGSAGLLQSNSVAYSAAALLVSVAGTHLHELVVTHAFEVKALVQLLLVLLPLRAVVQPGHGSQEQGVLGAPQLLLRCRPIRPAQLLISSCNLIPRQAMLVMRLLRLLMCLLLPFLSSSLVLLAATQ